MIRWQHIKSQGKQDETLQCSPVGLLRRRAPPPVGPGSGRSLGRRWRQLPVGTPSPRAQPATRETRELQTLLLDAEDPSAWRCPREGRECTIRAGPAPSPPSRLAAPQGDQGPARRDGGGKSRALAIISHRLVPCARTQIPPCTKTTPGKEPSGHVSVPATSNGSEAMDLPRVTPSRSLAKFR